MDPFQTLGEGYGEGRLSVSQSTVQVVALSIARVCRPDLRVLGRRLRLSITLGFAIRFSCYLWLPPKRFKRHRGDPQSASREPFWLRPNRVSVTTGIRSVLLASHFGFAPIV